MERNIGETARKWELMNMEHWLRPSKTVSKEWFEKGMRIWIKTPTNKSQHRRTSFRFRATGKYMASSESSGSLVSLGAVLWSPRDLAGLTLRLELGFEFRAGGGMMVKPPSGEGSRLLVPGWEGLEEGLAGYKNRSWSNRFKYSKQMKTHRMGVKIIILIPLLHKRCCKLVLWHVAFGVREYSTAPFQFWLAA